MGKRRRANTTRIANLQQGIKKKKENEMLRDLEQVEALRLTFEERRDEERGDDGEVELWDDVLVEDESDADLEAEEESELEEHYDSDEDGVESVDGVEKSAKVKRDLPLQWNEELKNVEKRRVKERERKGKYRAKIEEKKFAKSAEGSANIMSMFERARLSKENHLSENMKLSVGDKQGVVEKELTWSSGESNGDEESGSDEESERCEIEARLKDVEIVKYVTEEEKVRQKLNQLKKLLKSRRCGLAPQDRERHEMVRDFLNMKVKNWERSRTECAHVVADSRGKGRHTERMIKRWARSWEKEGWIERSRRGRNTKAISLLEDEVVAMKVRQWLQEKGEEVTSKKLADAFEEILREEKECGVGEVIEEAFAEVHREELDRREGKYGGKVSIKARTAREWLNRLGYRWKNVKKGVYVDGHERADVVEYRKVFVKEFMEMAKHVRECEEVRDEKGDVTGLRK